MNFVDTCCVRLAGQRLADGESLGAQMQEVGKCSRLAFHPQRKKTMMRRSSSVSSSTSLTSSSSSSLPRPSPSPSPCPAPSGQPLFPACSLFWASWSCCLELLQLGGPRGSSSALPRTGQCSFRVFAAKTCKD